MGRRVTDLTGQRFGRLVAIRFMGYHDGDSFWWARCDCGIEKEVHAFNLRSGASKSCGCYRREHSAKAHTTHGKKGTREYNTWGAMLKRCYNPADPSFPNYGARGIVVCQEWRSDFARFLSDMGPAPPKHTIDRIDVNGNYEPSNCRWATSLQQGNNKRSNVRVEFRGEVKTIAEWARHFGIKYVTLLARLMRWKWPVEKAMTVDPAAYRTMKTRGKRKPYRYKSKCGS